MLDNDVPIRYLERIYMCVSYDLIIASRIVHQYINTY